MNILPAIRTNVDLLRNLFLWTRQTRVLNNIFFKNQHKAGFKKRKHFLWLFKEYFFSDRDKWWFSMNCIFKDQDKHEIFKEYFLVDQDKREFLNEYFFKVQKNLKFLRDSLRTRTKLIFLKTRTAVDFLIKIYF